MTKTIGCRKRILFVAHKQLTSKRKKVTRVFGENVARFLLFCQIVSPPDHGHYNFEDIVFFPFSFYLKYFTVNNCQKSPTISRII